MYSLEALTALPLLGLRIHAPIAYLFTYLLNNNCPLRRASDVVSWHFSERFDFLSTVFGMPYSNECTVMIVPSDGQELTKKLPSNSLTTIN